MRGKVWAGILVPVVLVAGVGAYAVADARDLVPGWITTSPEPVAPAPFLSADAVAPSPAPSPLAGAVGDDAPLPSASIVQSLAASVRADARTGESTNISVIDVATGEVLADLDAHDVQVPASTTKLLTAISAVADLGPDYVMETTLTWDADARVLTLVAAGDMMLAEGHGHFGDGEDANGWAGLGDLADQALPLIEATGSGPIAVTVDDLAFEGPAVNPDWPEYATANGYVAAATGLAVDAARMSDDRFPKRFPDPSIAAGEMLASALVARGIDVGGPVTRAASPGDAVELARVASAPLSEVAFLLLRDSDNTVAEIVSRVHALETGRPTTPAGASAATVAGLEGIGAPVDGLVLYDGAGFSDRNRIAPAHLTEAILAALAAEPTRDLLDWLPIGGLEGTVDVRYEGTSAAGALRAKTGSLTGVTALAGTIQTADGRLLAFAMLADGMPYGPAPPRDAFDEMVLALAECGCEDS